MKTVFTKNLDRNNLVTKVLKQHWAQPFAHWAQFYSSLGVIFSKRKTWGKC